ncbi:hypothetical protein N474_16775 [Pseudoalteromonas luteoviolacea CPMOR-2]|uniref:Uncharacterized protein n=1 Tax=Pseudoalteromonas luteoviolacea DSM 6061 TaxID=1365250 RepID=A0A161ZRS8_9GAMM|nr:hypothetical protein N475_05560 [Pseudoalteromonas luteoviolacea DSM 6061]KZN55124.1 hypothetical protein N474_16775 [Pseudoalteromonas luteoviolacea CPMOR-2]MBE0389335.1 hypothetical protein [Pseudoalteromonas luteoviolacea DSM 6061]
MRFCSEQEDVIGFDSRYEFAGKKALATKVASAFNSLGSID